MRALCENHHAHNLSVGGFTQNWLCSLNNPSHARRFAAWQGGEMLLPLPGLQSVCHHETAFHRIPLRKKSDGGPMRANAQPDLRSLNRC